MNGPLEGASRVAFPTTSWTLIRQAQDADGEQRRDLLQALLRRYWKPIYAYFRAKGKSQADAEDLVQSFLNRFVVNDTLLKSVQPGRRFRCWVRVCARNFLIDQDRWENAARRAPQQGLISFAALESERGAAFEPADDDADAAFVDVWRRELLDRAMFRLAQTCADGDRQRDLDLFLAYFLPTGEFPLTWAELAAEYGLPDWQHAARKAHWVRARFAESIREEVRSYVDDESEIDAEIMTLPQ